MPRPSKKTTKSTYYKKRASGKRVGAVKYRKRKRFNNKKNAFNKSNAIYIPKTTMKTFVKHFNPGATLTNWGCLNDNNQIAITSTTDIYDNVYPSYENFNQAAGGGSVSYATSFNKMKDYYEKCCLVGNKLTITFTNTETTDIKIITGLADWETVKLKGTYGYNDMIDLKGHKVIQLNASGQPGSSKNLTFKVNPNKFTGHLKPLSANTPTYDTTATAADIDLLASYYILDMPFGYSTRNLNQDFLVFFYCAGVKLVDGTASTPRLDRVLESSYVFTDPKNDGVN